MKKNITCFVFLLFGLTSFGQTTNSPDLEKVTHQLGIDASGFINRYFSIGNQPSVPSPDIFFLYRKGKAGKNFRLGFGARFDFIDRPEEDKSSFFTGTLNLGKEFYTDFSKRWRAYYGWELKTGGNRTLIRVRQDGSKNIIWGLNARFDALVGLQWNINNRLSFSTEAFYGIYYTFRKVDEEKTTFVGTGFIPPVFITLNYHF